MDLQFYGKLVVVTGADSGIGLATAKCLAQEGARLLMTDLADGKIAEAAERVRQQAPDAEVATIAADLTRQDDVAAIVEKTEAMGGAAALAHLAGVRGAAGDFLKITDDGWRETLDIDLLSAVRICRALIPPMLHRGYGRIVLTASENAVQPYAVEFPYDAAKAGIINFGKALSKAYGKKGVHVNVVSPAFVETPMTDVMMQERAREHNTDIEGAVKSFLKEERPGINYNRRGKPEEIANVIAFLCSDRASYIDGANIRVDGGAVQTAFS